MESQLCPLCKNNVELNPRYPKYVCAKCIHDYGTKTKQGLPIEFFNVDFSGGFLSKINGEKIGRAHV